MLTTKHIYIVYKKDYARLAFFILIVLFHLAFYGAIAQQISETGLPYVQNYSAEDYGAFDQNWDAAQDTLGVMYFANGDGVLSYDGTSWELLELPNKGTVFALAASNKGEIYVGAVDELGYLKPNSKGQLLYISLLAELPQKFHDFSEIRALCSTKEGIFFSSKKYIFKWDGIKFETWENSGDTFLFTVHDTLLKRIEGKGLMRLKNNQFELVSQGELFSSQRIYSILPFNKKELLVATRDHLFIYDGKTFTKFDTNAPHFFTDNTLYNGVALNNGSFAFGSLHKGLLIIDTQGQSEVVLSQNGLLRSNEVLGLFQDQSGILWASLNSGIAKMEYPSPFSFFNKHNGAPDMIFDFQRYHGQLFIGGPEGLFYLKNEKNAANNRFERVAGDFGMVWDMILFQDKMLVGAISGVFEIDTLGKSKKLSDLKVSSLYQSGINANRVFIGTGSGLAAMYFKDGQWALEHSFKGINSHVDKIVESDEGHLWLDIDKNEVVSVSFDNLMDAQNLKKPVIRIFTPADGLPDAVGEPYMIENQFYLVADREAYRFDPTSKKFINDKSLFVRLGLAQRNVKINHVDEKDQIWLIEYDGEKRMNQLLAIPQKDGTYILNSLEEQRIMDLRKYGLLAELHDSVIWYQGKPGVVRHDVRKKTYKHTIKARAIISRVLWKNDSLLFGGYALSTTPQLPFKNNQLRFQYASPGFYDETKNQFQYYLEGFDDQWSPWTSEIKKDYTNLPEGDYSFKVRSRDVFNHLSIEDRYSFTILPPWYRTWWAYLTYGLGAIALALLISQWRSRELRKKNETLEGAVKERTLEIRHKNKLLSAVCHSA